MNLTFTIEEAITPKTFTPVKQKFTKVTPAPKRPMLCNHTASASLPYSLPATKVGNDTIIDPDGNHTASFPTLEAATLAATEKNYFIRKIVTNYASNTKFA